MEAIPPSLWIIVAWGVVGAVGGLISQKKARLPGAIIGFVLGLLLGWLLVATGDFGSKPG